MTAAGNKAEILREIERPLSLQGISLERNAGRWHVGVFREPYLSRMICGQKTIEFRFGKNRAAPYGAVSEEDVVFVKRSDGPLVGFLEIERVLSFDLRETDIGRLRAAYGAQLCVSREFWRSKRDSRYAKLIFIRRYCPCDPFPIPKKGMQTWIVL